MSGWGSTKKQQSKTNEDKHHQPQTKSNSKSEPKQKKTSNHFTMPANMHIKLLFKLTDYYA